GSFVPLNTGRADLATGARGLGSAFHAFAKPRAAVDPELVQQAIAVLRAYLEQAGSQLEQKPARVTGPAMKGTGNGRARMSREEALAGLGLTPAASEQEINIADRRLGQLLDPQLGGTPYLSMKINEARDILLGD